jgi:hypothetical protein
VTDGQKNKLNYCEPKKGAYHEKLFKQRLSKLRQIAKNEQDREDWADIYMKWLGGAGVELVVTAAGKKSLKDTFNLLKDKPMPFTKEGTPEVHNTALSTLLAALDWDGRMKDTGMLNNDTNTLNDEVVKQLNHPSFNAAAAVWDKKAKEASPTLKIPPGSEQFFAFHGEPKRGTSTKCVSHTIYRSSFNSHLLEDVECKLYVPSIPSLKADASLSDLAAQKRDLRWIFTCSYNRAKSACLDREKAMKLPDDKVKQLDYVQVLVVREEQVEAYAAQCGGSYIIAALPQRICFQYESSGPQLELDVRQGKIGYARLFCQLLAHSLGLNEIWMLDDNARRTYELQLGERGTPTVGDNGMVQLSPCSFSTVMLGIEQITRCGDNSKVMDPVLRSSCWFEADKLGTRFCPLPGTTSFRLRGAPAAKGGEGNVKRLSDYTGSSSTYGVVGMQRDLITQERGFKVTHSIYSFFLLNVAATVKLSCFYPARPIWEDIEFLHLLDEKGLAVCKVSKYAHCKAHDRNAPKPAPLRPVPPPPPPPQPGLQDVLSDLDYNCEEGFLPPNEPLRILLEDSNSTWLSASMRALLLQDASHTSRTAALLPLQPYDRDEPTPLQFSVLFQRIGRWATGKGFSDVILLVQKVDAMEVDDGQQHVELVQNISGLTRESIEALKGAFEKRVGFDSFFFEEKKYHAINLPIESARSPDGKSTAGTKHPAEPGPSNLEPPAKSAKLKEKAASQQSTTEKKAQALTTQMEAQALVTSLRSDLSGMRIEIRILQDDLTIGNREKMKQMQVWEKKQKQVTNEIGAIRKQWKTH